MTLFMILCTAAAVLLLAGPPRPAARKQPAPSKPGEQGQPVELVLDLAASLLEAGLPVREVLDVLGSSISPCAPLRTVARCLEMNMEWDKAWAGCESWLEPLRTSLHFAHSTGAPAASLLRSICALQRREQTQKVARLGAQFGTRLVLPLGLCALPAFIALGVVPLIIALFPSLG